MVEKAATNQRHKKQPKSIKRVIKLMRLKRTRQDCNIRWDSLELMKYRKGAILELQFAILEVERR